MFFIKFYFIRRPFIHRLDTDIRRIPDHRVESPSFHNISEFYIPIKGIDPLHHRRIFKRNVYVLVNIGPNQRIPAFDILMKRG